MERILCAANHYNGLPLIKEDLLRNLGVSPYNITSGIILCGWRHPCIIAQMNALTGLRQCEVSEVQGFLTSENRFVTRPEAADIAFAAGQIDRKKRFLFSEDLY